MKKGEGDLPEFVLSINTERRGYCGVFCITFAPFKINGVRFGKRTVKVSVRGREIVRMFASDGKKHPHCSYMGGFCLGELKHLTLPTRMGEINMNALCLIVYNYLRTHNPNDSFRPLWKFRLKSILFGHA